ncbi:MAG: fructose-bisphosphatase class II [bacterium]|nr:fructose-bisphosphatase class II [bacterium]
MRNKLLSQMKTHYSLVTARTALSAWQLIQSLHKNYHTPSDEIIKSWKVKLDEVAAHEMSKALHEIPFSTLKVGSEGDKEVAKDGAPGASVKGSFGKDTNQKLWGVSDVIEGTTPAAQNKPGASSVIAVTEVNGIMPTPKGKHYSLRLIGPPQAKGAMSLDQDHATNLDNLIQILKIHPHELIQVTMNPKDREINQKYIDSAKKVGVRLKIIDLGTFMPEIRASLDPEKFGYEPLIFVGRGGFEEGTMAMAAAKAVGGFAEMRLFDANPKIMNNNPLWTLDEHIVKGKKELTLVSASFITPDNQWFHKPGVRMNKDKSFTVTTLAITHKGPIFKEIKLLT